MNLALISLGCHKNLVDSENLLGILINKKGFKLTTEIEEAEVVVVNTCGFINDAKEESVNTILEVALLKKEAKLKKLIVAGCLAQRYAADLVEEIPEIDAIVGTGEIDKIEEIMDEVFEDKIVIKSESFDFLASSETERILTTYPHTAYLKISEGCDNSCTFCIIPALRGHYRSRTIEDVVAEAKMLADKGVRELNVISQDSTEYGKDLYGKQELAKLLREISKIEDIKRIRLFYTYPNNFTDELVEEMKTNDKICKYVDIPIQHISDSVLKRMGRRGDSKVIKETLNKIRENIEGVVFRTSIIVGFPGETEENFAELKAFMEEFQFDYAGIFKYSKEEDTPAFNLDNQIDEEVKLERWQILNDLQLRIAENKNSAFIGKEIEVMIDGISVESEYMLEGRTCGQALEIDGKVLINDGTGERGEIVKVKVEQNFEYDLLGG